MAKSAQQDFLEYYDKHIAARLEEIRNAPRPTVFQIWSYGHCSNPECRKEEPVVRDSRIYLSRESVKKALEQFPDGYIVEYPIE